jgi:isoamylase
MPPTPASPRDLPPKPGMRLVEDGAEFCVHAGDADGVELCLFDPGDTDGSSERRVPLTGRAHGWWFDRVPGVRPGQRYGVRVHGPWRPERGLRHNPAKLLLDPYARAVEGEVDWSPAVYGHEVDDDLHGDDHVVSPLDSAPFVPRCVVVDGAFDWEDDRAPRHDLAESVLYEAHVRSLTQLHPRVPEGLRGTYAGLAHPATVAHLKALGVTAVELLPVHTHTSEPHLSRLGLRNHWGYNTLGFFAPHARYASVADPQGVLDEFKGMVKLLHAEGIEVILDVVYNHTAEQSRHGATLSWRGLDNRAYYRLDDRGRDVDVTGCGNTLDLRDPVTCRMVLDSLRYWVSECHVDGFRFDLAVALARGRDDDFDPEHPFLMALRTDPVLSGVRLIAEPWDLGPHGWRTGQFPPPFSEWNDRFRDTVRTFWLPDVALAAKGQTGHGVRELATRLAGSEDLFGHGDRGPTASVNFVAAHDGFTVADLTAYDRKHNAANGEGNRDGSNHNRSWNHGVEGPTDDEVVLTARRRSMRNLLGTLLLATGLPMLGSGDEVGRSQGGNNNPYAQDNEVAWFDWEFAAWQEDLLRTIEHLTSLRRDHPVLRQRSFFTGREIHEDGSTDLSWYAVDGELMENVRWEDPGTRTLQMYVEGAWLGGRSALHVIHGGTDEVEVTLPSPPGLTAYQLVWDSAWERPRPPDPATPPGPVTVEPVTMRLYLGADPT